jgi:hypothetical protein
MNNYHIGLDFGTYQTKVCVLDVDNQTHEFIQWDNQTLFLPSTVLVDEDGTIKYGENHSATSKRQISYFKIAAAEDVNFRSQTFEGQEQSIRYLTSEFGGHSPELLSILYLTYVLYEVKNKVKDNLRNRQTSRRGFASLFARSNKTNEIHFTVQLGIPTEWSHQRNIQRKQKFEKILFIANELHKSFNSIAEYLESRINDLRDLAKNIHYNLPIQHENEMENRLNVAGLSVFPETAAGLYLITHTGQLRDGHYAIMDIGGGSTDISFLSLDRNKVIYLASESYLLAANDIYRRFGASTSLRNIRSAELRLRRSIENGSWVRNESFISVLREIEREMELLVYRLFNTRVTRYGNSMRQSFHRQPIIMYGGGSQIPIIKDGEFVVNDNGAPTSLNVSQTILDKTPLYNYNSDRLKIIPRETLNENIWPLLTVALGLSFLKPDTASAWVNEVNTNTLHELKQRYIEVQHPSNEGMYVRVYEDLDDKLF